MAAKCWSVTAEPCSTESTPAATAASTAAGHTACTATSPPAACTWATASVSTSARQLGTNSPAPRKSPMIFVHRPLRAARASSPAVTSRARPGKYPPGGARNRPAVTTRGHPASPASNIEASSGEPGSRIASTPTASSTDALARTRTAGSSWSPAGLARLRWLWTSARPGSTHPAASGSRAGSGVASATTPSTITRSRIRPSSTIVPRTHNDRFITPPLRRTRGTGQACDGPCDGYGVQTRAGELDRMTRISAISESDGFAEQQDDAAPGVGFCVEDEQAVDGAGLPVSHLDAGAFQREAVVFNAAQRGAQVGHHLLRPHDPDRAGGGAGVT